MRTGRVWIVSVWAAAALGLAACGRDEVAQAAREHGLVDEAAVPAQAQAAPVRRASTGSFPVAASTRRIGGKPMWADSRRYSAEANADYQFDQHGAELGAKDLDDFLAKAHRFVNSPPDGAKTLVRANGDQLIFDPASGLFGVVRDDGAPRTVFKPADGEAYWTTQVKANATGATTARRAAASGG